MRKEAVNMKKTPIWEKTIFAQFENSGLKNELMKWASKHRLNVVWGILHIQI